MHTHQIQKRHCNFLTNLYCLPTPYLEQNLVDPVLEAYQVVVLVVQVVEVAHHLQYPLVVWVRCPGSGHWLWRIDVRMGV